ncbi:MULTISPECIES: ABC transporter permease [Modestobacter]|jgi:peptide/nickel transport system permease protein|uniref:Peptide ABC transporter permease n=1 Tax=Modestobacter caceresii TaxID=1522368 RepID=A0A098Y442_9ACTN|nr:MULTISPECIES: ABC transporter permease [Modestobacter]KGH45643.1 peptide ABC transporter permease [Modestobacter caceresii]MCZ2813886.1 ABC transporter permease [Modestobacter sp. VKM Ac-2979]MCZ2844139.1 ABC transporter permease [Modestobacter sp. VKM Ac-2980]MCZ2849184.1 ABC transporter permease [Modestobacter sp. VKM Ac-2978]
MKGTAAHIVRTLLLSLITLFGVSILIFLMLRVLPGDPARVLAGLNASEDQVARLRAELGLDQSLLTQYWSFITGVLTGDLGTSARTSAPVSSEIAVRLPATLILAVVATIIGTIAGVTAGVVAAVRRNSIVDHVISSVAMMGVSMPVYWLGLLLILLFAVTLGWLPAAGSGEPLSIVLPAVTLAAFSTALISRMTRASMLEVLGQDYVRTAEAKGAPPTTVIIRHGLRNAFIPILTVISLQFGALLGGAVLTETVFGWPGIGRLLVDSIGARDFAVVQGIVLVYAAAFILLNVIVDVLYVVVDPRIRY